MLELNETYASMLKFSGYTVEQDGKVYFTPDEEDAEPKPTMVGGKHLVLPTTENLRDAYKNNYSIFHPLAENVLVPNSTDINALHTGILLRLNLMVYRIFLELTLIVSDIKISDTLKGPQQNKFFEKVNSVDKDSYKVLNNFLTTGTPYFLKANQSLIHIYLDKGGSINNERYSSVGRVYFPIYELIKQGKLPDFYKDKRIPQKKITLIEQLYEYIFPDIGVKDKWSYGSKSMVAPRLSSLMLAAYPIYHRINEVAKIFEPALSDMDEYYADTAWREVFNDLNLYQVEIRKVPPLNNNIPVDRPDTSTDVTKPAGTNISLDSILNCRPQQPQYNIGLAQQQNPINLLPQPTPMQQQRMLANNPNRVPSWGVPNTQVMMQPNVGYNQNMNYGVPTMNNGYMGQTFMNGYANPMNMALPNNQMTQVPQFINMNQPAMI